MSYLFSPKLHPADDAVPIGLCVFGIGVGGGIQLRGHAPAVVHHDGQQMASRLQPAGQHIALWRGDVVARVEKQAVEVDPRRLGALQEQREATVLPRLRHVDIATVCCRTLVAVSSCQVCRLGGVGRCVAETVGICRTGKPDRPATSVSKLHHPRSTDVDDVLPGMETERQKQGKKRKHTPQSGPQQTRGRKLQAGRKNI